MGKLFTHHDKYHIHKTLGIISIIHFFYRFVILFLNKNIETHTRMNYLYIVHLLLHLSSFNFILPERRIFSLPLIWKEFRIHNAIFATRNILPSIFPVITTCSALHKTLYVWFWMFIADKATQMTKEPGITMRMIPYPSNASLNDINNQKSFYVSCQFHATMLSITDSRYSFLCVFAIEIAAFAMTLCRKGFLSVFGWHRAYFLSLYSIYIIFCIKQLNSTILVALLGSMIAKEIRLITKLNKYVIWGIVIMIKEIIPPFNITKSFIYYGPIYYSAILNLYRSKWCLLTN